MTKKTLNKIVHSTLFHIFWGGVIYIQISNYESKTVLLSSLALLFVSLHFIFFTSSFLKELLFLGAGFMLGLILETSLSNSGVYHYGLIDTPGFVWPPPWIAALWLMFPPVIIYSFGFLKNHPIIGSSLIACSSFSSYYFVGKKMDLIFFNPPLISGFITFTILWFLNLRLLTRLQAWLKI